MKLNELTIKDALSGLTEKKFSSVELVNNCLKKINASDGKINAFITVCDKEAIKMASECDRLIREQRSNEYPLLGIPIALKDLFLTKGIKTTAGSKVLENYIGQYDATVVTRLKKSGAVIIGKTNCDAWAHGSSGENSDFGVTKNPWDLEKTPGGSSSGSAAAVAMDQCLAATGTDTGGSIRLPASFCNVVGLKPTYGRVSRYGIIAMASSLDSIGHLTKTVYDSALMLNVTAGKDDLDATTSDKPVGNYQEGIDSNFRGIRIGLPKEYFSSGLDKEVKIGIEKAIDVYKRLGAEFQEVSLPSSEYALAVYYVLQPSEVSSNLARYDGIRYGNDRNSFGEETKRRIILGTFVLSAGYYDAYYIKAQKARTMIIKEFADIFEKVDVLLAPVSPTLPFKIGEKVSDPLQMYLSDIYTVTANLTGIPGLSMPAGFVNGLPFGFQLLGPNFSEKLLFRLGFAYEKETEWYKQKPSVSPPIEIK